MCLWQRCGASANSRRPRAPPSARLQAKQEEDQRKQAEEAKRKEELRLKKEQEAAQRRWPGARAGLGQVCSGPGLCHLFWLMYGTRVRSCKQSELQQADTCIESACLSRRPCTSAPVAGRRRRMRSGESGRTRRGAWRS